jgi:hypothetical protein
MAMLKEAVNQGACGVTRSGMNHKTGRFIKDNE